MSRTKPNETPSPEWTPAQRRALEIESTNFGPEKKTQDQIAAELGIGRTTLYEWRQLPGWAEERARLTDSLTSDQRPDVVRALIESAKLIGPQGAADRRLYFQIRGELIERKELSGKDGQSVAIQVLWGENGENEPGANDHLPSAPSETA